MEEQFLANVVAVDMGYGHQRAAYPLRHLSPAGVINANSYPGIDEDEKLSWQTQTGLYEKISVLKKVPLLGPAVFGVMDRFQDIPSFYPERSLSRHTSQQLFFFNKVKHGLGKNLVKQLGKNKKPLLTTFPVPVYFAEYYGFKAPIFCVICDADISRFWAPINPLKSKTHYLVPTATAAKRLTMYGVKSEQIHLTGFPLPQENIGGPDKTILKADLAARLQRLDTQGNFQQRWQKLLAVELPAAPKTKNKTLTIAFAVGGAGAQVDIGIDLLKAIANQLRNQSWKLVLVAGSRLEVKEAFQAAVRQLKLPPRSVKIIYEEEKTFYFNQFNEQLRSIDILITKPSELSFYAGLGLPIIMTEPVGAQELANRDWLLAIGAGLDILPIAHAEEWLTDWLASGRLANAAFAGYQNGESQGAYNIEKILRKL